VQTHRCTRYSDNVTVTVTEALVLRPLLEDRGRITESILCRSPSSSSLKVNNRSFRHTSPSLWNHLPKELRQPADHDDLSLSFDLTHISSSFPSSPRHHPSLLLSLTP